jgi:hypothetical protein
MSAVPQLSLVRPLREDHPLSVAFMHADLARSGLVPEDLNAYPIGLQGLGTTPAYVIPYHDPRMYRTRFDRKVDKYTQPKNLRDVWWSPRQDIELFRTKNIIYLIEGEKKAAKFVKTWPGLPTFGIGGAHNALVKDADGTRRLLPAIVGALRPDMRVVVIFDGDIEAKPQIQYAAHNLAVAVRAVGCNLEVFRPPTGKGVDDWLVEDPDAKLEDLVPLALANLEESRKSVFTKLSLSMTEKGMPVLNELNAAKLLIDRFKSTTYIDKRLGLVMHGEVKSYEHLEYEAIEYIQGQLLASMPQAKINAGLKLALLDSPRDLLQEMFRNLEWDGVARLDTWGSKYFETNFPEFADEWGRQLITGMTLRVLEPGTKVDKACILIGAQGIGKSTFFEELATFSGFSFYHACTDLSLSSGDSNRTQVIAFSKSVLVDLAEGVIFETRKVAMDTAKQLITQVHDEYREVYAKSTRIEKRGFVFVGTTNRHDQLGDSTGSRRFLNLAVTKIKKLDYFEKLQIIAEVVAKEDAIRNTDWYNLRVKLEDAPEALRSQHAHITDVQALVNTQFSRPDAIGEFVIQLLESKEPAKLLGTDIMYITAGYVTARMGHAGDTRMKNTISRALSALSASPHCAYKLENARKRLPQLAIPQEMLPAYTEGISNGQQMINGFIVHLKEKAK